MTYLLYLLFRCDGCDGKFGNFVGTKHTQQGGRLPKPACSLSGVAVDATNNRSEANMWHAAPPLDRRCAQERGVPDDAVGIQRLIDRRACCWNSD